jgi:hypothetical protein
MLPSCDAESIIVGVTVFSHCYSVSLSRKHHLQQHKMYSYIMRSCSDASSQNVSEIKVLQHRMLYVFMLQKEHMYLMRCDTFILQ